jgi:TolB protein
VLTDPGTLGTGGSLDLPDVPRLVLEAGEEPGREFPLGDELAIGQEEDNGLRLSHRGVAGHHARVHREGNTYILTDLGSPEGVLVDGIYVATSHRLQHGQRLQLGDAELVFLEPGRLLPESADLLQDSALPPSALGPRRRRGSVIGLTTGGVVLLLALVATAGYLLVSSLLGQTDPSGRSDGRTGVSPATVAAPARTAGISPSPEASPTSPRSLDDLLGQAESLTFRSRFEEAITLYQEILLQEPGDARAEAGWAQALLLDGAPEQALSHAEQAAALDPTDAATLATLARAAAAMGYHRRALALARNAVDLDGSGANAYAALAEVYLQDDRPEEAAAAAEQALSLDPDDPDAHRVRGWLHYQAGSLEEAIGELRAAVDLQFDLWVRHYELGKVLIMAEDYQAAISSLMNAWVLRPKTEIAALLGQAYYGLEQYDNARPLLEYAVSEGVSDTSTYAILAMVEARSNHCQIAKPYTDQALAQEPQNPLALQAREACQGTPSASTPIPPTPTPGPLAPTPGPSAPTPVPPSTQGRIAFPVWNVETAQYDTYLTGIDGSDRQLVVEGMHQPALSPDGQWLAVNGERPDHLNLFLVRSDGSGLQEITEHTEDGLPAWSPDGQSLAFSSTRHGDKQSRVYIIDQIPFEWGKAQGRPLSFGPDELRGESPDWVSGAAIVYRGCDPLTGFTSCGLFLISTVPGPQTPQQLTTGAGDSAPSASGRQIAFMSDRDGNWELYTVDAAGSDPIRLTNNTANDGLPSWSPDGRTIAFVSDQGGVWAVWAVDADGANRRKLFDIGGGGLAQDWQSERISWGQ